MAESRATALVESLTAALTARAEILDAYLFGSQAAQTAMAHSDVDVAVFIQPSLAPPTPYGYAADLSTTLGSATGRKDIDVVVLNDASPLLYYRVLSGSRRLLSRDLRATTTREGRALSRYCDYLPQLRRIDAALAARLAAGTFGQ
jgi:predicted nucleotidyltransferase